MVTNSVQPKTSIPDFFVKNWAKLMSFRHKDYMWSRISVAAAGTVLTFYFAVDAFFFHHSDGELFDYIKVVGLITIMEVCRKSFLRLLELRDKEMIRFRYQ